MCLCIQMWYILADLTHDANWLYYLHLTGYTSECMNCMTIIPITVVAVANA